MLDGGKWLLPGLHGGVCAEEGKKERYYDLPLVLVEVSSPGTQYLDCAKKKQDYMQLPSLSLYLIIDSTRNYVTGIYRKSANTWEEFVFTNESTIHLPVIGRLPEIAFTAAQLYETTGVKSKLAGWGDEGIPT